MAASLAHNSIRSASQDKDLQVLRGFAPFAWAETQRAQDTYASYAPSMLHTLVEGKVEGNQGGASTA
jgi:hypothetical protein